jgi:hypothetical protein
MTFSDIPVIIGTLLLCSVLWFLVTRFLVKK